MAKSLRIHATITTVKNGVTYGCHLEGEFEVENSAQVVEEYEKLLATAVRSMTAGTANMTERGTAPISGETKQKPTEHRGTETIPIDLVRFGFDAKTGARTIALIGGKFTKFGIPVYSEKWDSFTAFREMCPDTELDGGDYKVKGYVMLVTRTNEGKFVLNDIRSK